MSIERQVEIGQKALGRLVRQFFAVNDFKHIQFMSMATAITGVRWLHSSQISVIKAGATKNLTGFPLFSIASVNRRIHDINAGLAKPPKGTLPEDWEGKQAMLRPDGKPLDIGDLWRIYFGEMEPPVFTAEDLSFNQQQAGVLSKQLHRLYLQHCGNANVEPLAHLNTAMGLFNADADDRQIVKAVIVGITELEADDASRLAPNIAEFLAALTGNEFSERQVFELGAMPPDA